MTNAITAFGNAEYRAIYLHLIESQTCPLCYASFFKTILTHVKQVVRSGPAFGSCSHLGKIMIEEH